MIATMIHGDPDPDDLRRFFRALRRAQRAATSTCAPTATPNYKNDFPERFTRAHAHAGRRCFEPYSMKEAHAETVDWITRHGNSFAEGAGYGPRPLREDVMSVA